MQNQSAVVPTVPTSTVWTVDDEGNIHFTLISNGMTREQWEEYGDRSGWRMDGRARNVLRSVSEAPTNAITYHVVVFPEKATRSNENITKRIRVELAVLCKN